MHCYISSCNDEFLHACRFKSTSKIELVAYIFSNLVSYSFDMKYWYKHVCPALHNMTLLFWGGKTFFNWEWGTTCMVYEVLGYSTI